MFFIFPSKFSLDFTKTLFPSEKFNLIFFSYGFFFIRTLNLISLVNFSFPLTTVLSFNLRIAFSFWILRIVVLINKNYSLAPLLPSNSPWYLIIFLRIVELVRISVRPITLCFRLLANIRAGHILLTLICKLPHFSWLFRGVLFGLLELLVALVQSFVFFILIRVYIEESISH